MDHIHRGDDTFYDGRIWAHWDHSRYVENRTISPKNPSLLIWHLGSIAAGFQSFMYGGFTPAGGIFATLTSMAMLGTLVPVQVAIAACIATCIATLVAWMI